MHEATLVSALLSRVEAEAARRGATAVRRVEVTLGELAGVVPEQLTAAWEAFRAGTCCEQAELLLDSEAARWECPRCGAGLPPRSLLRCPTCAVPARLAAGDGVVLSRLEMEVPDV
jgi:hydrogenase nickel incorporation protein HypA/HybF